MKKISIVLFFVGLAVITAAIIWIGATNILKAVFSIGWGGLAILTLCQVGVILLLAWAWHIICPSFGFIRLFWARVIREAAATCLPFSQVGGIIIGIRAVCFKGYPFSKSSNELSVSQGVSSNIVDITTEVLGQALFLLIGIGILISGGYSTGLKWPVLVATFILIIAIITMIWTQRQGNKFFQKVTNFLSQHIAQQWAQQLSMGIDSLQESLDQIWSNPKRVAFGSLVHFIAWMAGAVGTWICYLFLGANINLMEAIAIEALTCGAMSIMFLVPGSVGVQESAYIALGSIFGIDPNLSFGLSLLRRARDFIIGIPALMLWQFIEIRYLRKNRDEKKLDFSSIHPSKKTSTNTELSDSELSS